jgi:YVTN family beta-propeller protein
VSTIDVKTRTVKPTDIPGGGGVAITPDGKTAFVGNFSPSSTVSTIVSTIDVKTGTKHPTDIPVVGETPAGVAVTPDGKTAFVTNVNSVSTIDVKTRKKHPADIPVGIAATWVVVTPCRR